MKFIIKLTSGSKMSLIIFISLLLFSCKTYKDVSVVGVDNFHLNKLSLEEIEAELNLKIKNPNNFGFNIYKSEFDLIFSGIKLGKAKLQKRVGIAKNAEKVYPFLLKSSLADISVMDAMNLFNTQKMGKIEIIGDLKVGKWFYKKKIPINYSDRTKIFK